MLKRKVVLALMAPAVLGMLGVLAVAQAQSPRARSLTALDYAEIQQLYSRYAIGVDSGNPDLFGSVFTVDGTFELPTRTVQGRKQLAEIARPGDDRGPTNVSHVAVNIMIEPSPDGATGTSYFLRVKLGQKGEANTVTGGGVYRDTFVKTSEGWRIKKRIVQPAHSIPPTKTQ
jgi:3-phenylpropionate/cinnamic acid dioxygenase small subunit